MKLAIVGITGLVGRELLKVLEKRSFPVTDLIPVASEKSKGKEIFFRKKKYNIITLNELLSIEIDLALFSAGSEVSKIWAVRLAQKGVKIIDNSSYWRMCSKHKLIIPEINGDQLKKEDMIIANPNCSTIQLLMAIAPLHYVFGAKRVIVSTYQAVTGTGNQAVKQLQQEQQGIASNRVYPFQINNNVLPHCDVFEENDYTKEEMKLTNETKKILDKNIDVVATAVRVPVFNCHSESINVTFNKEFNIKKVREVLSAASGLMVLDSPKKNIYPMPVISDNKDDVYVGRIRRDFTHPKTLNMWVVADNLRKGAATNAIQIAEHLIAKKLF